MIKELNSLWGLNILNTDKIYHKIRQKGIKHYLKIILRIILNTITPKYSKILVFEILTKNYKLNKERNEVVVKIAKNMDEMKNFIEKRGKLYLNFSKKLFEKGNLCFYGEIHQQIVSCVWTSFNEVDLVEVKYLIKVDKKTVPLIDGYTLPEYRGQGVYKAVWDYCIEYFQNNQNYERIFGFILPSNVRSLKVHKKLQLRNVILEITYLRILGSNFHFLKNKENVGSNNIQ